MESLGELGERAIIAELLAPRYGANGASFGDDCASIQVRDNSRYQVMTTDPCPIPAASLVGFNDYYYWGWLLATINLSDIAAAGARPEGLLTSLVLPNNFLVSDFVRMHDGLDECLEVAGCSVLGGNLKEGADIALSATALGSSDSPPLGRKGARPGDLVVALGELGNFWAGYLSKSRGLDIDHQVGELMLRNVRVPRAKVGLGQALRIAGIVTACLDNSDGLYPSMIALSSASKVEMLLWLDRWDLSAEVRDIARLLSVEPQRLALGLGDWQLLVTVDQARLGELRDVAERFGEEVHVLGEVREGSGVRAQLGNR